MQILTGEDWNVVMYDGIQAYGGVKVSLGVVKTAVNLGMVRGVSFGGWSGG